MLEELYRRDRDDKLFAIRALKQTDPERRGPLLGQLVVDDDPVVRGKAAMALKDCGDEILLEAAGTLADQNSPETSILAAELLGSLEEAEPDELLGRLVRDGDERVVKAAIGALAVLSPERMRELLQDVLERYDATFDTALERLLTRTGQPVLLPVLKEWHGRAAPPVSTVALCMATGWGEEARTWVRTRLEEDDLPEERRQLVRWLLEENDGT